MSSTGTHQVSGVSSLEAQDIGKRYEEERSKRLRQDGASQFIDISLSDKFRYFQEDPWVDAEKVRDAQTMFQGNRCKILILGAGLGGILYAIRMVQRGISPEDIRIVDPAGGFGGTWYYNRYPGLQCDIESYLYLPLLEETGYMPKHRYASGEEIRNYANAIVEKYGLADSAVFQTKAEKLVWDEASKEWQVELTQKRKGQPSKVLNISAQFVAAVNGVLNWSKLPGLPGISDYRGDVFHSSRWNYSVTGGSPADPSLENLKDKRVAIIGTGASAVQAVPHLAKWSKHLYVVQRTPSAVDTRGQRETDPNWFHKEVANSKGWQRERARNFNKHFTTGEKPLINMVNDQWSKALGMVALIGNPDGPKTLEELPTYIQNLRLMDIERMNCIRDRVKTTVKDPKIAEKLQAWYFTWCKRPLFHDDYLETFNKDNVTLVDTDGKGVDCLTKNAFVVGGTSYPVDIIIFATGFRGPTSGTPAERANATITGRDGVSMTQAWASRGPKTLHGLIDQDFPNLFLSGPWQASIGGNYVFALDSLAKHAAYILTEAEKRTNGKSYSIAPTPEASDNWGLQIMMRSAPMAASMGCTPSYYNSEGDVDRLPQEKLTAMASWGLWGNGTEDYCEQLKEWVDEGSMAGIDVQM